LIAVILGVLKEVVGLHRLDLVRTSVMIHIRHADFDCRW